MSEKIANNFRVKEFIKRTVTRLGVYHIYRKISDDDKTIEFTVDVAGLKAEYIVITVNDMNFRQRVYSRKAGM